MTTTPDPAVSVSPEDTDGLLAKIRLAISDPRTVTPRDRHSDDRPAESVSNWSARAVLASVVEPLRAERDALVRHVGQLLEMRGQYRENWLAAREVNERAAETIASLRAERDEWKQAAEAEADLLDAELASRSTPPQDAGLPDALARLLWGLAAVEEKFVAEFGDGPSETREALAEVMRQANALSSPATPDPCASTLTGGCIYHPDRVHRCDWQAMGYDHGQHYCRCRTSWVVTLADLADDGMPVAPQSPAADTGTCPECRCAAPFHKTWCPEIAQQSTLPCGHTEAEAQRSIRHELCTPPAVPAVPEDTATPDDEYGDDLAATFLRSSAGECREMVPDGPESYMSCGADTVSGTDRCDDHRADTTRPGESGRES